MRVRFPLPAPCQIGGSNLTPMGRPPVPLWFQGVPLFGLMVKLVSHDNGIVECGEQSPVGPPDYADLRAFAFVRRPVSFCIFVSGHSSMS